MASPMSEVLGVTIFAGILWFGGSLVLSNEIAMNGALFLTYMGLFYNIISPAKSISTAFSNMQKGAAAIERIEQVLHAPVSIDDNPNGKKITHWCRHQRLLSSFVAWTDQHRYTRTDFV